MLCTMCCHGVTRRIGGKSTGDTWQCVCSEVNCRHITTCSCCRRTRQELMRQGRVAPDGTVQVRVLVTLHVLSDRSDGELPPWDQVEEAAEEAVRNALQAEHKRGFTHNIQSMVNFVPVRAQASEVPP